ncbi:YhgE/Pip domain-containing protein [Microbacterium horticulturae]|uniref:YhgE/Pip domain-containing protein n=1 Tax=Microbacterium horticulturae TaxID=3028316 RepID=A0ABY8BZN4_9MICO|nr:YhgE/Pip domain-containing protein [Microbacterium sp. KACC 23027]WEG09638.1 YhgE/Pip domain-containing protein [Microbacterium sp. KACC 23027]
MTLPIERSRSRKPVTWLTVLGVLLLPVLIGGILVAALYNPTERLDAMSAAVVNNDEPVTLNGQTVPLGRQLTAGLVKGSDDIASNLDWTISNTEDAKEGLADGTYQAVVTIPAGFSAAAVSSGQAMTGDDDPRQATIHVATAPDARVVDDAITAQVSQTAATVLGQTLSSSTLENVFLSFTTLGDQLGTAADGASDLADGTKQTADGTVSLADGIRKLSTGASSLADGADGISSGVGKIGDGAKGVASGVSALSDGASSWASGARSAADGLDTWAGGAGSLADSTRKLSDGLSQAASGLSQVPEIPQQVVDATNQLAANSDKIKAGVNDTVSQLDKAVAECAAQGGSDELCATLKQAVATAKGALPQVNDVIDQSGTIAKGVEGLSQLPQLGAGLAQLSDGMTRVAGGMDGLASGATDAAAGVDKLADGATSLASGAAHASSGASQLASGASQAADGAAQWASGAHTWADGADQSADGADTLATGVDKLADGADSLSSGLTKASDALPSFTDKQATSLAKVVADPVAAKGLGDNMFGASAIPLLAMLALWFGGLGSFIALQAVSRRALTSRRPSALLALRSLTPAAVIGAAQGLLVAGVVQIAASYDWGTWSLFAVVCVIAGVAFAAVNQALVAVFGGAGRWIGALVGVFAVATGVVSTVPGVLVAIASWLPTAPGMTAGMAALTSASGLGAGIAGLLIWALLAFGATILAVMRRRSTSAARLLTEVPAAA